MEIDKYFENLEEITGKDETNETDKEEITCCGDMKHHILDGGIIKCSVCMNTVSNIIAGPEWRFYGANDSKSSNPTRCGMPINELLPKSSSGTSISYRGGGAEMHRVRKFQQWNGIPYRERSLLKVFQEISEKCKKASIPEIIIKEAQSLYSIISSTKISRGANRKGIIAACVYFSCKDSKVPRSVNEIADVFDIKNTILTKGCKQFKEIIQMNKLNVKRVNDSDSVTIDDFIVRFCSKLHLDASQISVIQHLSQKSQELSLVNENTPPSMAAGCIYLYIKENKLEINKSDISEVCKISEVTINKCYKKLELLKEELFN